MSLILRFVNSSGIMQESFLDMIHVATTRSESLMAAKVSTLNQHAISLSRVRGQEYDGTSNMRGKLNRLKTIIKK